MLKAHALILSSPTYFAAISADLKALIERAGFVAFANNHAFSSKIHWHWIVTLAVTDDLTTCK
jgi:multimeric flavodoxin WrbA